jgi:hypothetical protein
MQAALTESDRERRVAQQSVLTLFNLLSPEGAAPPSPAILGEHKVTLISYIYERIFFCMYMKIFFLVCIRMLGGMYTKAF